MEKVVGHATAGRLFAFGSLWDVTSGGDVIRVDPSTGKIIARIHVQGAVDWQMQISAGFGSIWVASGDKHEVVRIAPQTNTVSDTISGLSTAYSLLSIGIGFGSVWADQGAGAGGQGLVYRINPSTNAITDTLRASHQGSGQYGATDIAFGGGAVWVGNANSTVSRIDPNSNRVVAARQTPLDTEFIAYGFGSIWLCDDSGYAVRISAEQFKSARNSVKR
jgi:hypothetical protein